MWHVVRGVGTGFETPGRRTAVFAGSGEDAARSRYLAEKERMRCGEFVQLLHGKAVMAGCVNGLRDKPAQLELGL